MNAKTQCFITKNTMLVLFKVMIHRGVNEIPEAHIMKRWTRNARDYEYPNEVCTTAGEQLGQSLLFANALDVVKSTERPKSWRNFDEVSEHG